MFVCIGKQSERQCESVRQSVNGLCARLRRSDLCSLLKSKQCGLLDGIEIIGYYTRRVSPQS